MPCLCAYTCALTHPCSLVGCCDRFRLPWGPLEAVCGRAWPNVRENINPAWVCLSLGSIGEYSSLTAHSYTASRETACSFTLWEDGAGFKLTALFGAGGTDGKATFIRAITLTKTGAGAGGSTASLALVGSEWVLSGERLAPAVAVGAEAVLRRWLPLMQVLAQQTGKPAAPAMAGPSILARQSSPSPLLPPAAVLAMGQRVPPLATARAGANITVQASRQGRAGKAAVGNSAVPPAWTVLGQVQHLALAHLPHHNSPRPHLTPTPNPMQATPVQAGKPFGVIMTPFLRIRAEQRGPATPLQQANPRFGNWLDV